MNLDEVLPPKFPAGWNEHPLPKMVSKLPHVQNSKMFVYRDGLTVLASLEKYGNETWYHVSFSYADKLPPWATLKAVKNIFIGIDKLAIQVLPREDVADQYTNFMPFCLHLWRRMDGDTLPTIAPKDISIT